MCPDTLPAVTARLATGRDAIAYLATLLPADGTDERLVVVFLDDAGHVLGRFEQPGDPSTVALPFRAVIASALAHDARALLLAHNHPSGNPTPSPVDIEVTRLLAAAARPLGLTVYDHLVRAADEWCSFLAMELM